MINVVVLSGRVVRDIELRTTTSGKSVANFSLAVGGNDKDEVSFFNCVAFGKTAEILEKYAPKGKLINVAGKLQQRKWKSKDGEKQSTTEVFVRDVQLVSSGVGTANIQVPVKHEDVVLDDIDDKPINLDNIPF